MESGLGVNARVAYRGIVKIGGRGQPGCVRVALGASACMQMWGRAQLRAAGS